MFIYPLDQSVSAVLIAIISDPVLSQLTKKIYIKDSHIYIPKNFFDETTQKKLLEKGLVKENK